MESSAAAESNRRNPDIVRLPAVLPVEVRILGDRQTGAVEYRGRTRDCSEFGLGIELEALDAATEAELRTASDLEVWVRVRTGRRREVVEGRVMWLKTFAQGEGHRAVFGLAIHEPFLAQGAAIARYAEKTFQRPILKKTLALVGPVLAAGLLIGWWQVRASQAEQLARVQHELKTALELRNVLGQALARNMRRDVADAREAVDGLRANNEVQADALAEALREVEALKQKMSSLSRRPTVPAAGAGAGAAKAESAAPVDPQLESAEAKYRARIEKNPNDAAAVFALATVYEFSFRGDAAAEQYRRYLSLRPDAPNADSVRAWIDAFERLRTATSNR